MSRHDFQERFWFRGFVGREFPFGTGELTKGMVARCTRQISEKDHNVRSNGTLCSEAVAVFAADVYKDDMPTGDKAILKIFMQVPYSRRTGSCTTQPMESSQGFDNEKDMLEELRDCPHTPTIYNCVEAKQTDAEHIPGGYLHIVVMQRMPGVTLAAFHRQQDEQPDGTGELDRIIAGFKLDFSAISRYNIYNYDRGPNNIIWDAESGTCYIVDFEDFDRGNPVDFDKPHWTKARLTRFLVDWGFYTREEVGDEPFKVENF